MAEATSVPVLFVRDPIVLPGMVVPIALDDAARVAVDAAQASESGTLLIAPRLDDRYPTHGVLASIVQVGRIPGGGAAAVVRGERRAHIGSGTTGPGAALWVMLAVCGVTLWLGFAAGVLLGDRVPTHWGLDFAGPLVLIGVVGSMLVDRATWVAAGVAAAVSVLAYALPLKLNVLAAIVAAVAAGLLVDHRSTRAVLPLDDRT